MNKVLHPCFDETESGSRIHLPIAKKCNTKCNYCKMSFSKFEIRPGVTDKILDVNEIPAYVNESLELFNDCKIIGIAGPGDPLANPDDIFAAFESVSKNYPDFKKCMCTNGFGVEDCADKIKEAGINYITLTINSINVSTISNIYKFINYRGKYYEGERAAELILRLQKSALDIMSSIKGLKIKINIVFIPGINDKEIDDLIQFICTYKIDIINIIPLLSVSETEFGNIEPLTHSEFCEIRKGLEDKYPKVKFKRSCQRCRSDARGRIHL